MQHLLSLTLSRLAEFLLWIFEKLLAVPKKKRSKRNGKEIQSYISARRKKWYHLFRQKKNVFTEHSAVFHVMLMYLNAAESGIIIFIFYPLSRSPSEHSGRKGCCGQFLQSPKSLGLIAMIALGGVACALGGAAWGASGLAGQPSTHLTVSLLMIGKSCKKWGGRIRNLIKISPSHTSDAI